MMTTLSTAHHPTSHAISFFVSFTSSTFRFLTSLISFKKNISLNSRLVFWGRVDGGGRWWRCQSFYFNFLRIIIIICGVCFWLFHLFSHQITFFINCIFFKLTFLKIKLTQRVNVFYLGVSLSSTKKPSRLFPVHHSYLIFFS